MTGPPIDRGWAWMICLGTGVQAFFVIGGLKTMGVIFVEIIEIFGASRTVTSLTLGFCAAGFAVSAMLSNVLSVMLGARVVTMIGALCCVFSVFMSAFTVHVWYTIMFLGLLDGFAFGSMMTPSILLLSMYFDKRKSFANGLALTGASIGQLAMPYIMTYLLEYYGYFGAMLLNAAITMHAVAAAMLLRPLTFWTRKHKLKPTANSNNGTLHAQDTHNHNIELYDQNDTNRSLCDLHGDTISNHSIPPAVSPQKKAVLMGSRSELRGSKASVLENAVASLAPAISLEDLDVLDKPQDTEAPKGVHIEHRPSYKLGHIRLKTLAMRDFCRLIFDREVLRSPCLWLLFFALGFGHAGFIDAILHLPALCYELFHQKRTGALLVTLSGVFDLVGRLGGGWFADQGYMSRVMIIAVGFTVTGASTLVATAYPVLPMLIVYAVLMGIFGGLYRTLLAVVSMDLFGRNKTGATLGMLYMSLGVLVLPVPTILGFMQETYHTYIPAFQLCGALLLLGALLMVILRFVRIHDPHVLKPDKLQDAS